jgi:IS30 family transposase
MIQIRGSQKVAERREKVLRLYFVRQWTQKDIAKALGVTRSTVDRDIHYLREYGHAIGGDLISRSIENTAFELQEKYEERQRLRWQEYSNAPGKQKAIILNDIAFDEERHLKMMQSLGVVTKAPEKVDLAVNTWLDIMKKAAEEDDADAQP